MKRLCMLLCAAGMDALTSAHAVEPRALLEVADIGLPIASPDGMQVAFRIERADVERNTYDAVWYVQDMDGATSPRRIADGGAVLRDSAGVPLPATAQWSPDGYWLYYRALLGGRLEVWRAAADGSGASQVTDDPADVRTFSLSADGATLTYSVGATRAEIAGAEQAEYDAGIRIDKTVPIGQNLFRSSNIEGRLATQRYSKTWFDRVALLADTPNRWKAVDVATGVQRELSSSSSANGTGMDTDPANADDAPWKQVRSDNGWIAMLTRTGERKDLRDKPDVVLSVRAPDSRQSRTCTASLCTGKKMTGIQWRPNHNEVLFTVTDPHEGMAQSIYLWNVGANEVRLVVNSPGLVSGGRDQDSLCGVSSVALVCVTAEADQPPRLERIDLESGARRILFVPNAALAWDMEQSVSVRLLRWMDKSGQEFTGQFYPARSSDGSLPPLFVNYYSCTGFVRGGVGDEWPFATLAEHGISSLCINAVPYRVNAVERYDLGLSAVGSVIDLLAQSGEIDRSKVGMGGLSFGTEVTFWAMSHSDLIAAGSVSSVFISGNYYLQGSLKGDAFFPGLREFWQLGTPDETPEQWQRFSEATRLDKVCAPILMQVPEQEYMQTLDYTIPLLREQRADLYVFPNEPHQKFQPKHKLAVYERNVDWFRFWLQGYEDPDHAKHAQYEHWRVMREQMKPVRASAYLACKGEMRSG